MGISPRLMRRIERDFPDRSSVKGVVLLLGRYGGDAERNQAALVLAARGSVTRLRELCDDDPRMVLESAGLAPEDWEERLDQELGTA